MGAKLRHYTWVILFFFTWSHVFLQGLPQQEVCSFTINRIIATTTQKKISQTGWLWRKKVRSKIEQISEKLKSEVEHRCKTTCSEEELIALTEVSLEKLLKENDISIRPKFKVWLKFIAAISVQTAVTSAIAVHLDRELSVPLTAFATAIMSPFTAVFAEPIRRWVMNSTSTKNSGELERNPIERQLEQIGEKGNLVLSTVAQSGRTPFDVSLTDTYDKFRDARQLYQLGGLAWAARPIANVIYKLHRLRGEIEVADPELPDFREAAQDAFASLFLKDKDWIVLKDMVLKLLEEKKYPDLDKADKILTFWLSPEHAKLNDLNPL